MRIAQTEEKRSAPGEAERLTRFAHMARPKGRRRGAVFGETGGATEAHSPCLSYITVNDSSVKNAIRPIASRCLLPDCCDAVHSAANTEWYHP
jgi:hypothetical protein